MGGKSLASTLLVVSFMLFVVGFGLLFSSDSSITGAAVGLSIGDEQLSSDETFNEGVLNESSVSEEISDDELGEFIVKDEHETEEGSSGIAAIDGNQDVYGATASCQDVSSSITLSGNIVASGTCFDIVSDNIEIDGNGFSLTGDGTGNAMIINTTRSNVTIHNFSNVSNFSSTLFDFRYVQENLTFYNIQGEGPIIFWYSAGGYFNDVNLTDGGGIGFLDTNDTLVENSNFSSTGGLGNALDLIGTNRNITSRNNHFWNVSGSVYRISSTTTDSLFENDLMTEINVGVQSQSEGNVFRNLQIISPTGRAFFDQNDNVDTLEYNNSFGLVRWNRTRTTVNAPGELKDGTPILIEEENITYYPEATIYSQLENDMEIAFYGLTYDSVQLIRNDVRCDDDPVFCNASYYGGVLYANVSAPANFTVNGTSTVNAVPTLSGVIFNGTDSLSNLTFDDFSCYTQGVDDESSNLTAQFEIYNSSSLFYSGNMSVFNDTLSVVYNLSNATVFQDETWTCGVSISDGTNETSWQNSSVVIQACGDLTRNYVFSENIVASGDCYRVMTAGLVFDLNGYRVSGDGTGAAFSLETMNSVTIKDGTLNGFFRALNVSNSDSGNFTNLTIQNSTTAVYLSNSSGNTIEGNVIKDNSESLNFSSSNTNVIVNNFLNSTVNAIVGTSNIWNTTYACSDSYSNIIGGNCSGGNYWSDYTGVDNGNGSAYPSNISQDKIGDNSLPWNSSAQITVGGDYLPLVYACVESWTCGDWSTCSSSSQSRTCTDANNCGTITSRPALTQSCSSGGGGGGGGGSSSSDSSSDTSTDSSTDSSVDTSTDTTTTDSVTTTTPTSPTTTTPTTTVPTTTSPTSTETSDDGGVEIPPPSEDVYASAEEISGVLTVEKAVVTDSTPTTTDSTSTEGTSSAEGSSSGNLAGFAGSTGTDSTVSKPAPSKVNDVATAKEAANTVKKKVSINLANDGTKKVQLKPQVRVGSEDSKLIVTRKTYKSGAADSGISVSKTPVTGDLLRASLTNTKLVEINPGERVDIDIEVAAGFSTKNQIPVKVELLSYDGVVYEEEILIDQEPALASAVVPHVADKTLDLYAMIVDKSDLTFVEDTGNSLTGAAVSDLVFDNFVSKEDYYLEVTVIKDNEGVLNTIPVINWFVPNQKVVFAELYGPYPIESQEGFVFAQQFSYDPTQYEAGDYIVQMRIMQGLHELSLQEFEVYLE